jgi:MFS family permease
MERERASFADWALAVVAASTMAVSYVDRQTLAVVGPTICSVLQISERGFSLLIIAFAVAYLAGAPVAGRLVDLLGARRGLLGAVVGWTFVAALHALVPSFAVLLALRIALGLAESPSFPGAVQTVQRALPPRQRGLGFGILFCGSSIGAAIAGPLGDYLCKQYGFRVAFVGTAIAGLIWVPAWLVVAFNARARKLLEVDRKATDPLAPSVDQAAIAEAAPAAPAVPLRELLAKPEILRLVGVVAASAPFLILMMGWAPKYLVAERGLKQGEFGWLTFFPPIIFDVGSIGFGIAASRLGNAKRAVAPGLLALAALLMTVGAGVPFALSPASAMAFASVAMAGGAGMYVLATLDATSRVSPGAVASVGGIGAAAQSIVQIAASAYIGEWLDRYRSYSFLFVSLALWALPGAALWLLWDPRRRQVEVASVG